MDFKIGDTVRVTPEFAGKNGLLSYARYKIISESDYSFELMAIGGVPKVPFWAGRKFVVKE